MNATLASAPYMPTTARPTTGRAIYGGYLTAHLSWKAIIAGAIAALGIQLILSMIGGGVLASRINPATDPTASIRTATGIGTTVWLIVSGVISFGVGGLIAGVASVGHGRHSYDDSNDRSGHSGMDGALHGALAWCLAAVIGVLATTIAGAAAAGAAAGTAGNSGGLSTATGSMGSTGGSWGWNASTPSNGWQLSSVASVGSGSAENGIVAVGPYGQQRTVTEAEARLMAENAAEAASRAALITGVAFALALASAVVSGGVGRHRAESRHEHVTA